MIKVLDGVRVLEHGTFITGPAASMLLADLGADVVKVALPGTGDPFRAFKGGLYSPHYQTVNRNKRSVTLNTKQAADLEKFDALVSDIGLSTGMAIDAQFVYWAEAGDAGARNGLIRRVAR